MLFHSCVGKSLQGLSENDYYETVVLNPALHNFDKYQRGRPIIIRRSELKVRKSSQSLYRHAEGVHQGSANSKGRLLEQSERPAIDDY